MDDQAIYGAMLDEYDLPFVIYRVRGTDVDVIRRDGGGWEPDERGTFMRRAFDSTDPWLTEDEAHAIIARWRRDR